MKARTLIFALTATLLGSAALAQSTKLSGMGAYLFGNGMFNFDRANLSAPVVEAIKIGKVEVVLQRTKLKDLQKHFGGTIMQESADSAAARWLCYATDGTNGPAANSWFISNALGGGEFVMIVAIQDADPKRPAADCAVAPANFAVPELGIPGLGAKTADLKEKFGAVRLAGRGAVSYRGDEPAEDGLGTALNAQYIGYIVTRGLVSAVGVGETSTK